MKKTNKVLLLAATMLLTPVIPSVLAASPNYKIDSVELFKKKKKKGQDKKTQEETKSKYDQLVGSATKSEGMFNVYKKDKDYFFEIPMKLMGKDMLVVNKLQRVPAELNDAGVNRGVNYEHNMIRFEWNKENDKLMVRQSRPLPISPKNDAITQSVKDNYISPLIASFKVDSYNADSTSVVIKVNDIYDGTETSVNNVFTNINLGTSSIKDLSKIQDIKTFHNNVVAYSELTTKVIEGMESVHVTVEVSSTILLLPETPMVGRLDNQRVGYFTTDFLSYSDKQQKIGKEEYITRWRMEPKPEDVAAYKRGELVEPAKPIVFYLDNSTPQQWREYIRMGVEDWQVAFEKAGFKNAIVAKDLPDSINAEMDDINYSVITYAASAKMNAMGPSILDPRSGEILEADIMWWHNVLTMLQEWNTVQTGAVREEVRGVEIPENIMGDAIRFVACHEVGHSLGLRHNMMGSWAYQTDSLRSEKFTTKMNSTSSSIMDYARYNYVAQPEDGVKVLSPHIGPYDMFAIGYGYRWFDAKTPSEEKAELHKFLKAHDGRLFKYSEAQDPRDAVDPRAQNEDMGDDAMKSSKLGIKNLKRVVPNILKWTTTGEEGQTYDEASRLYYAVISQWNYFLYHVMANIGGIYIENTTVGDGVQTYTHVEKKKQREAVQFLLDEVLCYPEWLFNNGLGDYTFLRRDTPIGQIENAPHKMLKNAQAYIFWDLLSNNRLMRMLENESANGNKAFTAVDLMDMLHKGIFKTTEQGGKVDVMTRNLQKGFVDALITAAAETEGVKINKKLVEDHFLFDHQTPFCNHDEFAMKSFRGSKMAAGRTLDFYGSQLNRISDAISVKRGELIRIKKLVERRANSGDIATQYHYQDLILRINTALGLK